MTPTDHPDMPEIRRRAALGETATAIATALGRGRSARGVAGLCTRAGIKLGAHEHYRDRRANEQRQQARARDQRAAAAEALEPPQADGTTRTPRGVGETGGAGDLDVPRLPPG